MIGASLETSGAGGDGGAYILVGCFEMDFQICPCLVSSLFESPVTTPHGYKWIGSDDVVHVHDKLLVNVSGVVVNGISCFIINLCVE